MRRRERGPRGGRFFCSAWNRGACGHAGSHEGVVTGRIRDVDHFCATCWLTYGEYAAHPECECPRAPVARRNQDRKGQQGKGNKEDDQPR